MLRGCPPWEELTLGRIGGLHEALRHDPASVTAQASGGDGYTTQDHLLFLIVDELRTGNWMRTKDGSKGRNRPKPISPLAQPRGKRTGRTDLPPSDVIAVLSRIGAAPTP